MNLLKRISKFYCMGVKLLNVVSPVFDLGVRLYVATVFIRSGILKFQSWETTLYLFENEYDVPFLPTEIAAYMGTAAELVLPVFLVLGFGTRFFAAALFIFNAIAVISYPDLSESGLKDHILWGSLMLITVFHGPGKLSLDYWLGRKMKAES